MPCSCKARTAALSRSVGACYTPGVSKIDGRKLRHTITREAVNAVLANLSDGSAPFIALAAERAGLNRNTVKDWIAQAERSETTNELCHELAREVRRIRAEWMARVTRDMQASCGEDKLAHHSMKQKAWLMERVDRDLFDISNRYLPKGAHKVLTSTGAEHTVEPASLHSVLDELEKPDLHEAH